MPQRIAVHQIKIGHGKGKQTIVKPGELFNFTDAQIDELTPLGAIRTVPEEQAVRAALARHEPDEPALTARAAATAGLTADEPAEGERAPADDEPPAKPAKAKPAAADDEL